MVTVRSLFFDMWPAPPVWLNCSAKVPEVEAKDRPADPESGGSGAPDANITEHEASFEHADGCFHTATEALKEFEPSGMLTAPLTRCEAPYLGNADMMHSQGFEIGDVIERVIALVGSCVRRGTTKLSDETLDLGYEFGFVVGIAELDLVIEHQS